MEFTGEKFIPSDELSVKEIGIEHLHRYHSVLGFVKDKSVLDIACGEGYGSDLMAKTAKLVYGVDIDPEAIAHASATYQPKKEGTLKFLQGSVEQIPLPDHLFDVVISFETIEHVDGPAQQKFMDEVKRVLKDDGLLIISTPDKKNYSERYGQKNEYHIKEFDRGEFSEFIEKKFTHTRYFDQGYEIVSAITETNPAEVWQVSVCDWDRPLHPFARKYLLAVASNRPLPKRLPLSSVVFQVDRDYQATMDHIVEMEASIVQLGEWGKKLDQEILRNRGKIKEMEAYIVQLGEWGKNLTRKFYRTGTK